VSIQWFKDGIATKTKYGLDRPLMPFNLSESGRLEELMKDKQLVNTLIERAKIDKHIYLKFT
jgi:hypothetical protein